MIGIKDGSVECLLHWHLTGLLFSLPDDQLWWVTSGSESGAVHGQTSLHYALPGCAVDLRLKSWPRDPDSPESMVENDSQSLLLNDAVNQYCMRHKLPRAWFDVVREKNHIHLEFQPKRSAAHG